MAAWLDGVKFNPTLGGTTDFVVSSNVIGFMTPATANAVNARVYKWHAESADLSQWEDFEGAYTVGTTTVARTTVLYNSSGTGTLQSGAGTKIAFSTVPTVSCVALKGDMISIEEANSFTATQQAQALSNLGLGAPLAAWSTYTPTCTSAGGTFTTVSATGRYKIIGKIVFLNVTVTITTVGTATGNLYIPLPVNAQGSNVQIIPGGESAITGFAQLGQILTSNTTRVQVAKYDGNASLASGAVITISGVYESV